jgi:hypothetical protein
MKLLPGWRIPGAEVCCVVVRTHFVEARDGVEWSKDLIILKIFYGSFTRTILGSDFALKISFFETNNFLNKPVASNEV